MKHLRVLMIILSTQVCVFVDAAEQRTPASSLAAAQREEEEKKEQGIIPSGDPALAREMQAREWTGTSRDQEIQRVLTTRLASPLIDIIKEYADEPNELVVLDKKNWINAVAISPDQKFIVIGGKDVAFHQGFIKIVNMDGSIATDWTVPDEVGQVAISLKDQYIVVALPGSEDSEGWIYTGDLNEKLNVIEYQHINVGRLKQIAMNEEGVEPIIVSVSDNSVDIWDVHLQHIRQLSDEGALAVAMSADGQFMVTVDDNYGSIWDRTGETQITFPLNFQNPTVVAINPHNKFIAIGYKEGAIEIINMAGEVLTIMSEPKKITALSIGSQFVMAGSQDGIVRIWDSATRQEIRTIDLQEPITSIAISPDESFIAITTHHKLFFARFAYYQLNHQEQENEDDEI